MAGDPVRRSRRHAFTFGCVLLAGLLLLGLSAPPTRAAQGSEAGATAARFTELVAALRPGTWFEIPDTRLEDAFLSREALQALASPDNPNQNYWGHGPHGIVNAWCGWAADTEAGAIFAFCGGHAYYGGTEVYAFQVQDTGLTDHDGAPCPVLAWCRINDPSAYADVRCWGRNPGLADTSRKVPCPEDPARQVHPPQDPGAYGTGCGTGHNYGATLWHPGLRRIVSLSHYAYGTEQGIGGAPTRLCILDPWGDKQWRRIGFDSYARFGRTILLPDGTLYHLGVKQADLLRIDDELRVEVLQSTDRPSDGESSSAWNDSGGIYLRRYKRSGAHVLKAQWIAFQGGGSAAPRLLEKEIHVAKGRERSFSHRAGIAWHPERELWVLWDGERTVWTMDRTGTIAAHRNRAGPAPTVNGSKGVYRKWFYLPRFAVFVGYNNHKEGVWLYRLPSASQDARGNEPAASEDG